MQGRIREEAAEPGTYRTGGGMVGQGRGDDAGDDRPGFAKARSQDQGKELRLVADFGQGNDCGGNEQGVQHQGFPKGRVDTAMTRTAFPPRVRCACHRSCQTRQPVCADSWVACAMVFGPSMLTHAGRAWRSWETTPLGRSGFCLGKILSASLVCEKDAQPRLAR